MKIPPDQQKKILKSIQAQGAQDKRKAARARGALARASTNARAEPTSVQQRQFELEFAYFLITFRVYCLVKQMKGLTDARSESQWFPLSEHADSVDFMVF